MAESEKLEYEDFINPEAEKRVLDFISKVKSELSALGAQTIKDLPKTESKPRLTDLQKEIELQKKLEEATKGLNAVEKLQVQLSVAKAAQRKQERADINAAASAYDKLSQQLNKQKKEVKDLLASKKELSEVDKELIENTKKLDKELKDIDATVGDHTRNVGAYKEALQDVQAEMGVFGGLITRITRTLKVLDEQNENSTSKTQKFGNVLKAVGIGIALFVLKALSEANDKANEMSEALGRASEKFEVWSGLLGKGAAITTAYVKSLAQGFNVSLSEARNLFSQLIDQTIKYNEELRKNQLELQKLNLDQKDFNEIATDTTIGYNERIDAQKKSMELGLKIAAKNTEIAQSELDIINKEIKATEAAVGVGNVSNALKNKQNEAQLKYNEAIDAEGDLTRQNATKIREINEQKTIQEIDLLLKKKESANAQKAILEEELKDQKKQLEERRATNDQLLKVNNKTTEEELAIFKKGFNVKFNSNKLLMEQDAIILQQKILALKTEEGHGLGEAGVAELAKIIKSGQENQIENKKNIAVLDDEEAKRQQKIFEIKTKISEIDNQQTLLDLEEQRVRAINAAKNKVLANIIILDIEKKYLIDETDAKKRALIEQEKNAEIMANNTINDTKILNEEILRLQAKLQYDLNVLDLEALKKAKAIADQKKQDIKQIAANEVKVTGQVTEGVRQGLEKREELQQQSDQRMIDFHTRTAQIQATLAAGGKANTLGVEEAAAAKAEEKKIHDAKKAAKLQETVAVIEAFEKTLVTALESNKTFPVAFGEAIASSGIVTAAFSKLFTGFYEGTESLGESDGVKLGSGKDNILIRAHKGERIMGVDDSAAIPNWMSNSDVVDASLAYANGLSYLSPAVFVDRKAQENNMLYNEMRALRQAVENQPVPSTKLDGLGEWTEEIREGMNNTIIHHKKNNSRPSLRIHG